MEGSWFRPPACVPASVRGEGSVLSFKRLYLFIHERHTEAETQAEGEAGSMQPNVGLDPGTPGSCPELKGDAQLLSHPGAIWSQMQTIESILVGYMDGHTEMLFGPSKPDLGLGGAGCWGSELAQLQRSFPIKEMSKSLEMYVLS